MEKHSSPQRRFAANDRGRLLQAGEREASPVIYLTDEHFADDALWPVQFEPRPYIRESHIANAMRDYDAAWTDRDPDMGLARAGTELAGNGLKIALLIVVAILMPFAAHAVGWLGTL